MNCAGRRRGELRELLALVFSSAAEVLTWRDAAALLVEGGHLVSVGASELRLVRQTVENMTKAGELCRCGSRRVAGSWRPMTTYRCAVAERPTAHIDPWRVLSHAMLPDSTN